MQVELEICKRSKCFKSAVNLGSPLGAGTPVTLEVDMRLVYERKLKKNGLFFSRTRPLFLGMEGG